MNQLQRSSKPIAIWLLVGVFMIIIQIILGGITRLTDSGLSITEWKPLLGAVPPTNEEQWREAFEHYKKIAQYKNLHSYFTLEDFKSIYFWEWLHRLWGRLIGIVFLIPFIVFLLQGRFKKEMIRPMIILFLLGGLQGLVGWIMVKSGLNEENIYVSHIRLGIHFIMALGLLVYTFWFALKLLVPQNERIYKASSKKMVVLILSLLVIQLIYGAFMAGLKAASVSPTWPTINGEYFPPVIVDSENFSLPSLINNSIVVQFIHRNLAYLIFFLILFCTIKVAKEKRSHLFDSVKWYPLIFVCLQVVLGVIALFTSINKVPQRWGSFEWTALLHQAVAMLLLLSLTMVFYLLTAKETSKSSVGIDKPVI
jgi:cytochrome c oxidase assembly protein subunit 15